jgi:ribosomal protein L11 methyltransferase
MDYFKFSFTCDPQLNEILIAFLNELPFDTFQENENGFDGFIPSSEAGEAIVDSINDLKERFSFTFQKEFIHSQNWNKIWESNFHPVVVGDFCGIRADFHEPLQHVMHELVINPKMAFGTGHHETTHMVIEMMRGINFKGKTVLDYGCGTGILAILASKLGATTAFAVDIEQESFQNTVENSVINQVNNCQAFCGELEVVPKMDFDIVLANINRNVILNSLDSLKGFTRTGTVLVFSGFIADDEPLMKEELNNAGYEIKEVKRRNNWIALKCCRL